MIPAEVIAEGTEVEMEHTPDRAAARKIALDHLREDPFYYTKLRALEKGLTGLGDSCYNGRKTEGSMDGLRDAIEGTKRLMKVVKAALPEGTVSHRKDGDWKKTGGQWVRMPAAERQGQDGKSDYPSSMGERGRRMLDAATQASKPRPGYSAWEEAKRDARGRSGGATTKPAAPTSTKKFTSVEDKPQRSQYGLYSPEARELTDLIEAGDAAGARKAAADMGGRAAEYVEDRLAYEAVKGKLGSRNVMTEGKWQAADYARSQGRNPGVKPRG